MDGERTGRKWPGPRTGPRRRNDYFFLWQSMHLFACGPAFFSVWQPPQSLWAGSFPPSENLAAGSVGWQALQPAFSPWTLWLKVTSPIFDFSVTVSAAITGAATNSNSTTTAT